VHIVEDEKFSYIPFNCAPYILYYIFVNYMLTYWRDCYVKTEALAREKIEKEGKEIDLDQIGAELPGPNFSDTLESSLNTSSIMNMSSAELVRSSTVDADSESERKKLRKTQIVGGFIWNAILVTFFALSSFARDNMALGVFLAGTVFLAVSYMFAFCILLYVVEPFLRARPVVSRRTKFIALNFLFLTIFTVLPLVSYNFLVAFFIFIQCGFYTAELISVFAIMYSFGDLQRFKGHLYRESEEEKTK